MGEGTTARDPLQSVPVDELRTGPTLTLEEAAARYGFSIARLRRRIETGGIPGAHQDEHLVWQVPVAALELLGYRPVKAHERGAPDEGPDVDDVERDVPAVAPVDRDAIAEEVRRQLGEERVAIAEEWRAIVAELRKQLEDERRALAVALDLLERQLGYMESIVRGRERAPVQDAPDGGTTA